MTYANRPGLNHSEGAGKIGLVLPDRTGDDSGLLHVGDTIDANEHDTAVMQSLAIDELTKILVFGDQDSRIEHRRLQDNAVLGPVDVLGHPPNVVPVIADSIDDQPVHAFVGEKSHADFRSPTACTVSCPMASAA